MTKSLELAGILNAVRTTSQSRGQACLVHGIELPTCSDARRHISISGVTLRVMSSPQGWVMIPVDVEP